MSDNLFQNVGRVELEPSAPPSAAGYAQAAQSAPPQAVGTDQKASAKTNAKPAKPANSPGGHSLKFKIDANTNDVTIMILDRASKRVVRTIPPEEIKDINPGELLELFG